jgi:hypothetical protein
VDATSALRPAEVTAPNHESLQVGRARGDGHVRSSARRPPGNRAARSGMGMSSCAWIGPASRTPPERVRTLEAEDVDPIREVLGADIPIGSASASPIGGPARPATLRS